MQGNDYRKVWSHGPRVIIMKAKKQKSIKGLLRQLLKETVYSPARVSEIVHSLEIVIQKEIDKGTTYKAIYLDALRIAKELHIIASASISQPIIYKIGSSNKFESLKEQLKQVLEELQGH